MRRVSVGPMGHTDAGGAPVRYVRQVLLKYVLITVAAVLVLPAVGGVHWGQALWMALVATVVLYLVVDRLVLPGAGNSLAVVVDFVLAVGIFMTLPLLMPSPHMDIGGALTAAGAIALIEILYHQFLLQRGPIGPLKH